MKLTGKIKETVVDVVNKDIRILSVVLHGSVQKGTFRPDSDIDLGIIIEDGVIFTSLERIELGNRLSYLLGRTVDLGEISSKNLIYASEAFFNGDIIYTRDESRSNLKRATLIGLYFQLNIDRKEILNEYRA